MSRKILKIGTILIFYLSAFIVNMFMLNHEMSLMFIDLLFFIAIIHFTIALNIEVARLKKRPIIQGHIKGIDRQMGSMNGKFFTITFVYNKVVYEILEDVIPDSENYPCSIQRAKPGDVVNVYVVPEDPRLSISEFKRTTSDVIYD
jgi:hypothetical protein